MASMDCCHCQDGSTPITLPDTPIKACIEAEPGRYVFYTVAGCPFAARPWAVLSLYGLDENAVEIVKCFPGNGTDGWFFPPGVSEWEKIVCEGHKDADACSEEPVMGAHHLKQVYGDSYTGRVTVPILYDTKDKRIVSNDSMELGRALCRAMAPLRVRNQNIDLYPAGSEDTHNALCKEIHDNVNSAVYKINSSPDQAQHNQFTNELFAKLAEYDAKLAGQPFLMGDAVRYVDLVFFATLIRFDIAYRWAFKIGGKSIQEGYPNLWQYVRRIMAIPGVSRCVIPADIVRTYWLSLPLQKAGSAKPGVPQVAQEWINGLGKL
eukprot:jgi/Mesvir1/18115/Mv09412-RA.1